jgi:hypothetical protein
MKNITNVVDCLYANYPKEMHWSKRYDKCCMIQQVLIKILPKANGQLPQKFILNSANGQYKLDILMSPNFYHKLGLQYYSPFNRNTALKILSKYLRENDYKLTGADWKTWKQLTEEFGLDPNKKYFK